MSVFLPAKPSNLKQILQAIKYSKVSNLIGTIHEGKRGKGCGKQSWIITTFAALHEIFPHSLKIELPWQINFGISESENLGSNFIEHRQTWYKKRLLEVDTYNFHPDVS